MNKFGKRIQKIGCTIENCLVVGLGYGKLQDICEAFNTVFIINDSRPNIKLKNLIFRENFDHLGQLGEISAIFFDRDRIENLKYTIPIWLKDKPLIIIEGEKTIEREFSKDLYEFNYQSILEAEIHHIWKKEK